MTIPNDQLEKAREMIENAARPLFFHDDDGDGVSCFVMCYQFKQDGKGVCVKRDPIVKEDYTRKVDEYSPDLVVIMDKPHVAEEFLRKVTVPILWIDHHEPQTDVVAQFPHVTYLNPRSWNDDDNRPTSYWVYLITKTNLWMAAVGTIADWYLPDFLDEVKEQYPGFLPEKYERVEDLYLDGQIGQLIKVITFNLKGSVMETRQSVITLTRIESPEEILQQTTSRGRFLWKKYRKHAAGYERHLERASREAKKPGKILLYVYDDQQQTYTSELSNELLIRFPEKITIVCRQHDGKRKCSIRSKEVELPSKVKTALEGLDGRGGGHTNACGVVVSEEDWETFLERLKKLI